MRKILLTAVILLFFISCTKESYKDGSYEGGIEPDYEGYSTKAKIVISNGKVMSVDFQIFDANNNAPFDKDYQNYMNNDYYKKQCREDWAGLNKYLEQLNNGKDFKKIDSISGATWSYDKLKYTLAAVLSKAVSK